MKKTTTLRSRKSAPAQLSEILVTGDGPTWMTVALLRAILRAVGREDAVVVSESAHGSGSHSGMVVEVGTRSVGGWMDGLDGAVVRAAVENAAPGCAGSEPVQAGYSLRQAVWQGAYVRHGLLIAADAGRAHVLATVRELHLPGAPALEAVLAAVAAARLAGVAVREIREALGSAWAPLHRLTYVGDVEGVELFDDAACSSPEELGRSLQSFDGRVTLIAGGEGFAAGFELLESVREKTNRVLLLPGTPGWIATAWSRFTSAMPVEGEAQALGLALDRTAAGGRVLFCPGCVPMDGEAGIALRAARFLEAVSG